METVIWQYFIALYHDSHLFIPHTVSTLHKFSTALHTHKHKSKPIYKTQASNACRKKATERELTFQVHEMCSSSTLWIVLNLSYFFYNTHSYGYPRGRKQCHTCVELGPFSNIKVFPVFTYHSIRKIYWTGGRFNIQL